MYEPLNKFESRLTKCHYLGEKWRNEDEENVVKEE